MRRLAISVLVIVGTLIGTATAGQFGEVELVDGSVICGEIISFDGGMYTLKSGTVGTVTVEASKIRTIRFKPPVKTGVKQQKSGHTSADAQIHVLKQAMMGDQEIIRMILSLLDDPDVQEILQDPSITKAMNAGDIEALTSNPKFMKLLENPTIQDITGKMME